MKGLQSLPPELIELVVIRLNFQEMCSMRLVSRDISAKSEFGVVKSDFAAETVILTSADELRNSVAKTAKGWTGCLMDEITIVSLIPPREEAVNVTPRPTWSTLLPISRLDASSELALTQVFTNHRRHSPQGYLNTLSLRVKQRRNSGRISPNIHVAEWRTIWETVGLAYRWVMRALSRSGLLVQHLDVFGSDSPRCSLAFDWFRDFLPNIDVRGLRTSLHTLTHLSICLSKSAISQPQADYRGILEHEPSRALASLVASCPSLTSLNVRWYENAQPDPFENAQQMQDEEALLAHLTKVARGSLLGLRHCHLQGILSTESDLLACIECMPCLQTLSLEKIFLGERILRASLSSSDRGPAETSPASPSQGSPRTGRTHLFFRSGGATFPDLAASARTHQYHLAGDRSGGGY